MKGTTMRNKDLIKQLLDAPMNADVHIAGGGEGVVEDRDWDGEAMDITIEGNTVFIHFNETGMNNHLVTEVL